MRGGKQNGPKATNQSQIDRVKDVERYLSNILSVVEPQFSASAKKGGGIDSRISNISKMTKQIEKSMKSQNEEKQQNEPKKSQETNVAQSLQNKEKSNEAVKPKTKTNSANYQV